MDGFSTRECADIIQLMENHVNNTLYILYFSQILQIKIGENVKRSIQILYTENNAYDLTLFKPKNVSAICKK